LRPIPNFIQQFDLNLTTRFIIVVLVFLFAQPVHADPNQLGQTGLINMPDARIDEEGTLRFGLSYMQPYSALWASVSFFSWLEMSGRYTEIDNVEAFVNRPDADFGDYKDKAFDTKIRLLKESKYFPQITFGAQDFLGTQVFEAAFLSLSKQIGEVDFTLGYGEKRIDGLFGGIQYTPKALKGWSFVAEYDAFDYKNEFRADQSGAEGRQGGFSVAANYRWGWLGTQLSYQEGNDWGILGYVAIPLQQPEFVPKIDEPKPYTQQVTRPTLEQWQDNPQHSADLIRALEVQQYKDVRVFLNETQLELGVATDTISLIGKAVGRAVRTALLMSPIGTKSIKVTYYTLTDLPVLSYRFNDLAKLEEFFSGGLSYGDLIQYMSVEYANPQMAKQLAANKATPPKAGDSPQDAYKLGQADEGHAISLKKTDANLNRIQFVPFNLGLFFNDPSGALKYDWFVTLEYQRFLGNAWFFNTAFRATVLENVSDVTQPSNSTLPHVRSDIALYAQESGFKIDNMLVNKYMLLSPRIYGRLSAGIYELMFGGAGGQVLYLPKEQNWALDLDVNWLQQRDYEGLFGFLDYQTTTAIASLHYRVKKYGLTFTLRGGKFLAKDTGARFEFSRRFSSGIKLGAWYTHTNGNDITSPGTPSDPYQDKGIFMEIPLNSMLTRDTRATRSMSIRPWTRDGGQMVVSPGDLYEIFDDALMFDRPDLNILSGFHD
jgi:hypothetical protein